MCKRGTFSKQISLYKDYVALLCPYCNDFEIHISSEVIVSYEKYHQLIKEAQIPRRRLVVPSTYTIERTIEEKRTNERYS